MNNSLRDNLDSQQSNVTTLGGFARALHLLEFDQIRQRLAGYARTVLGQERALGLEPVSDALEIGSRLQETDEARLFLDNGGSLEFGPGADLREYVERAMLGGSLRGEELHQVQQLAEAAGFNRKAVYRREDLPLLSGMAANIPDLGNLEQAIRRAISPAGEILDDASPELRQLRRESRSAYQHLNEVMQRSLRRYQQRAVVQEPIITQRNGRLVLLIKAEHKSQAPGIVHDVSDSGATVFIEPLPAIETGNRWRETRLAEEREEERVLRALASQVGDTGPDLLLALDLLARLDLAMAKGRYSVDRHAVAPAMVSTPRPRPISPGERGVESGSHRGSHAQDIHPSPSGRGAGGEGVPTGGEGTPTGGEGTPTAHGEPVEPRLRLSGARHPLLTERVVPISVELGGAKGVMAITGPNAGGKTVALKTVGLLALMAHAGLHVPAEAAEFPLLDGIYVDIGDQQSIEQSLSTFSSHIQNLRSILEQVTPRSLVLIDELGTSTDPEEGAALAQAILGHLSQRSVMTVATTHHRGVAHYVQEQAGMVNASVDLDPGTLEPTYRITLGLPGRSYALTIADRLGLAPEILEEARSLVSPTLRATDDLVQELQQERAVVAQLRQESEELLARARAQQAETEARLATVESSRLELVEEARQDLQSRIGGLLAQLQRAERAAELAEAEQAARRLMRPAPGAPTRNADSRNADSRNTSRGPNAERFRAYQEDLAQFQKELNSTQWEPIEVQRTPWQEELRSGDRVYIRGIPRPVEVISPQDDDENIEVLLGTMRARIPVYQLERPAEAGLGPGTDQSTGVTPPTFAPETGGSPPVTNGPVPNGIDPNNPGVRFRHNRDAGVYYRRPSPRQVKSELDLRGQRVDEALDKVETLLNQAALSGVAEVRIIHGRGTGALRRAVREYLKGHPLTSSYGSAEEGANDGVTVVELK